jgi:site-specific DNA-cytosine methylase
MILKESGRKKGKNLNKTLMKEIEKPSIDIEELEKDEFCQKVLQKNFKNIPIEGDIRNVKGEKYKADVVTGGFPCQPFSVAGKRKGTDDDRYLWDETIRVVRECKPKWFIGENVEGLINIQEGMVLRQVQTDLEKEGFEVQCLIIPASGIGAWHQRKRVWIIGCNVSNSNTRFGIGENQEIQTRGNTSTNSSKNVSNTFGKLSNGCSSTTRNSTTEFKRMECNQSWNWRTCQPFSVAGKRKGTADDRYLWDETIRQRMNEIFYWGKCCLINIQEGSEQTDLEKEGFEDVIQLQALASKKKNLDYQ